MWIGKWNITKTSWFGGTIFSWNEFRLNSGRPYTSWRFGPLFIRKFDR